MLSGVPRGPGIPVPRWDGRWAQRRTRRRTGRWAQRVIITGDVVN
jgi:hypothetical protein